VRLFASASQKIAAWRRSFLCSSRAVSSVRSSWLRRDLTWTVLIQPDRTSWAIDRASLRSLLFRFIATIAAFAGRASMQMIASSAS